MTSVAAPHTSLTERLKGWLEHPFGKFLTGVVFPALVAVATSVLYQTYTRHEDNQIKVADAFINESLLYEKQSLNMLEPLLSRKGQIDAKDRQSLINNLIEQSQTLYAASNVLKENKRALAEKYQQELLDIRSIVSKLQPQGVTNFYNASRPFLEDRDRIIYALEPSRFPAAASIPSTPVTPDAQVPHP